MKSKFLRKILNNSRISEASFENKFFSEDVTNLNQNRDWIRNIEEVNKFADKSLIK